MHKSVLRLTGDISISALRQRYLMAAILRHKCSYCKNPKPCRCASQLLHCRRMHAGRLGQRRTLGMATCCETVWRMPPADAKPWRTDNVFPCMSAAGGSAARAAEAVRSRRNAGADLKELQVPGKGHHELERCLEGRCFRRRQDPRLGRLAAAAAGGWVNRQRQWGEGFSGGVKHSLPRHRITAIDTESTAVFVHAF